MSNLESILVEWDKPDFYNKIEKLSNKHSMSGFLKNNKDTELRVREIVAKVGEYGDKALVDFTAKFDSVNLLPSEFQVSIKEMEKAHREMDKSLLASLCKAIENVREYQSEIFVGSKNNSDRIRYRPLNRVGLCIPGASAPLPSTVIMTAVPAIVAGVKEIVVISPPRHEGSINPVILGLCFELGIKEVYRIGGAQAVAALAWGTETIKKVDKIVGPGNDYVQLAKKEVFGLVDMDSFAGPSDVLIVADDNANPAWVAADMLSQAEHNPGSAILVTHSKSLAKAVCEELDIQVANLSRSKETLECLLKYSAIVCVENVEDMLDFANRFAAEHLEVQCGDKSHLVADKIDNAGAIFIGNYTPVATGDYWAGPSHTLPTRQTTKYFSPLSSNDFIKSSSIIEYSKEKLQMSSDDITRIAMVEGLDAHAKSISIRCK